MIRAVTVDDIRVVYDMMFAYYEEWVGKYGDWIDWNQEKSVIHLGNLLYRDTGLNFITEGGEGVILGELGETWFGQNAMAKPHVLYVKPEHRNGLIARALLRRFEKTAKERGAKFVIWEFETGLSEVKFLGRFMEALGYEYQGPIYQKIFGGNESCHR